MTNEWSFVFIGLAATVKLLVIVIILMLEKFSIFFSQRISVANNLKEYIQHMLRPKENLPEHIQVWYTSLYNPFGPASFFPLMRIHRVCASVKVELNDEKLLLVNPIRSKYLCSGQL